MAKWAAMCLGLIACGGSSGPKHAAAGKHDAGAHDAAPRTHDAAAHDAVDARATDARATEAGEPMMNAPDAAADAAAAATCADQSLAIAQKVIDAINTSQVTNRCTTDSDCFTLQTLDNSCYDGCPLPTSRNGLTVIQLALDTLERKTCPAFIQSGCTIKQPMCPQPPSTGCQDGRCVVLSGSAGQQHCENLSRAVSDSVLKTIALADRHCLADTDCAVLSPGNPCFSDCEQEVVLSHAGVASVQTTIDAATIELCPAFFGAGCELNAAVCGPPTTRAVCIDKTCGAVSR